MMTQTILDTHHTMPDRQFPDFKAEALAGTSFRFEHMEAILADKEAHGFFEIHAENYMGAGGPPHAALEAIREKFPVSLHGVCMSLGGPEPLSNKHLSRFKALVERYQPALISEHLAWSTHDETFMSDLLPLPYTAETLDHVSNHVSQMQDAIGRKILLENPSTYLLFEESTLSETDFLRAIVERTGCGLLLDINNVFVSATNHGYSARHYLDQFPLADIGEIHLAGHAEQEDDEGALLLIDSHDRPVSDPVWTLFEHVIARQGPIPTLVEWDSEIPAWDILKGEANATQTVLAKYAHRNAA